MKEMAKDEKNEYEKQRKTANALQVGEMSGEKRALKKKSSSSTEWEV